MKNQGDKFSLHDLRVTVIGDPTSFVCSHRSGDSFAVIGEDLVFRKNQRFSLYALAAILPLLPAKQRQTQKTDWMATDMDIACPDPNCGAKFRIERTKKRSFRHSEVTKAPLRKEPV